MNQLSGQIMCANRYVLPPTVLKVIGLYELNHFHTNLNMYIINPKSGILETSKILGSKGALKTTGNVINKVAINNQDACICIIMYMYIHLAIICKAL